MRKKRKHKKAKAPKHVHTIRRMDVNKLLSDVVLKCDLSLWLMHLDIGKRVYEQNGVYQIENQEQFERRISR